MKGKLYENFTSSLPRFENQSVNRDLIGLRTLKPCRSLISPPLKCQILF